MAVYYSVKREFVFERLTPQRQSALHTDAGVRV